MRTSCWIDPSGGQQTCAAHSLARVPRLSDDGRVLVEDGVIVGIHASELSSDVLVEGSDDCVLGHVLNLVSLGVRVGDVRVLIVVVDPVGGAWCSVLEEEG